MTWQQESLSRPVSPWAMVAAILLPPLGGFMARGITPAFWWTTVATLIAWVPGVVLAVLLLLIPQRMPLA